MKFTQFIVVFLLAASCATSNSSRMEAKARQRMNSLDQESQNNINMLIGMIEEQSHLKDAGAKRWIPYEFRIPVDNTKKNEVHRIDPSIQFINRTDSYQCIGENATKEKIFQIVALPYAYKIKFCPFE